MMEGDVVAGRQLVKVLMIGGDGDNLDRQQTAAIAEQQVVQAVAFLAHQQHGAHRLRGVVQRPLHAEILGKRRQRRAQGCRLQVTGKLHAHEK